MLATCKPFDYLCLPFNRMFTQAGDWLSIHTWVTSQVQWDCTLRWALGDPSNSPWWPDIWVQAHPKWVKEGRVEGEWDTVHGYFLNIWTISFKECMFNNTNRSTRMLSVPWGYVAQQRAFRRASIRPIVLRIYHVRTLKPAGQWVEYTGQGNHTLASFVQLMGESHNREILLAWVRFCPLALGHENILPGTCLIGN